MSDHLDSSTILAICNEPPLFASKIHTCYTSIEPFQSTSLSPSLQSPPEHARSPVFQDHNKLNQFNMVNKSKTMILFSEDTLTDKQSQIPEQWTEVLIEGNKLDENFITINHSIETEEGRSCTRLRLNIRENTMTRNVVMVNNPQSVVALQHFLAHQTGPETTGENSGTTKNEEGAMELGHEEGLPDRAGRASSMVQ
ncbi:hypothetical protein S7711_10874 [Stachybotrys chartarum IBT 7711]|uniref:Uncharacterized protein n=1 Tax=Stachybotrys chartarum (strain CBS 109288 / IBT 7711) TaxID=1280523 RepID=A0A084B612_STACB|nr:hypothetical protein S7711_10874 [Stachybotrys chartarum IBT 7711]